MAVSLASWFPAPSIFFTKASFKLAFLFMLDDLRL
jgi:hypothetical protein